MLIVLFSFLDSQSQVQSVDDTVASCTDPQATIRSLQHVAVLVQIHRPPSDHYNMLLSWYRDVG